MNHPDNYLEVYFIAGTQDVLSGSLPEVLEEALIAGITCFQYREKGVKSLKTWRERREMAQICQKLCWEYQVPFIINDDTELALEIEADGIHVGQEDQEIEEVLSLFSGKIVGLSCYDEREVLSANHLEAISYYGIGPVFKTISKEDVKSPIGIKKLRQLVFHAQKPCVAIGGINNENSKSLLETGIAGVAVISAITRDENKQKAVQLLKRQS